MVGIVTVGALLVHGWQNVGSWLAECWFMVGGLMLGQRVSNEQSNVGPTKYVAVGPTLNQRLGFGWQMVDVLAGLMSLPIHIPIAHNSRVFRQRFVKYILYPFKLRLIGPH